MVTILGRVWLVGGALCLGIPVLAAELLPDPTRPPSVAAQQAGSVRAQVGSRGLKSIRISPGHRSAVINGRTVEQGARIGNEILVEVRDSSVVLQGPQGRRVLELFPGVSLRQAAVLPQRSGSLADVSGVAAEKETVGTDQTRVESQ